MPYNAIIIIIDMSLNCLSSVFAADPSSNAHNTITWIHWKKTFQIFLAVVQTGDKACRDDTDYQLVVNHLSPSVFFPRVFVSYVCYAFQCVKVQNRKRMRK